MSGADELQNEPRSGDRETPAPAPPDRSAEWDDLWFDTVQVYDAGGRVARDVRCLECHYNLRTLRRDARCPECGRAVAASVSIYASSPEEWLRSMAGGASVLAHTLGLIVECSVTIAIFTAFNFELLAFLLAPVVGVCGCVAPFGLIKLTARRPNLPPEQDDPPTRSAPRICMALAIGSVVLGFLSIGVTTLSLSWFGEGLLIVAGLAMLAIPIAICRHVGTLMHRINRPDLERFARLALVVAAALELLGVVDILRLRFRAVPASSAPLLAPFIGLALLLLMTLLAARVSRALRRRADELAAARVDSLLAPATDVGQERTDAADETQ